MWNVMGYGYTLSLTNGIRIDSLGELRMEQQLREITPSTAAAANGGGFREFFLKNPFTTSLFILGIVLAYESLVDSNSTAKKK